MLQGTEVCMVSDEAKKYAEKILGETPEVRQNAVEEIRRFLDENPSVNGKTDSYNILTFLRCCKFDIEKTKVKIKKYYEMRAKVPEWFSNRDPLLPEIDELLKIGVFVPVIQRKPGPLLVIIRTGAHDPQIHVQNNVFKTGNFTV